MSGLGHCHLSPRETQIVTLALAGLEDKEIAQEMNCAASTVQTYWHRVYDKTGFRSRRRLFAECWTALLVPREEAAQAV